MMMALASAGPLPTILIPGGVTLLPEYGEDAGKVQTIGARYAQKQITLEDRCGDGLPRLRHARRRLPIPGHRRHRASDRRSPGTLPAPHRARSLRRTHLARRRPPFRHAPSCACINCNSEPATSSPRPRIENAMVAHAAFGGSTNLLLHLPAIAYSAGLKRPVAADWAQINRQIPRLVDALPNGPRNFATVQVFLAGGLPEVMLHLRRAGLLNTQVKTVSGETLDSCLDWWEKPPPPRAAQEPAGPRRHRSRRRHHGSRSRPLPRPHPHRLFPASATSPRKAPSSRAPPSIPRSSMPTASFVTSDRPASSSPKKRHPRHQERRDPDARRHGAGLLRPRGRGHGGDLPDHLRPQVAALGKHVALLTDARFSGVSTGACIGHISPEALAGGAIGKLLDGDQIEIIIDREKLTGSVNLVGDAQRELRPGRRRAPARSARLPCRSPAASRASRRHPALGRAGAGQWRVWGGCVYDVDAIVSRLQPGPVQYVTACRNLGQLWPVFACRLRR